MMGAYTPVEQATRYIYDAHIRGREAVIRRLLILPLLAALVAVPLVVTTSMPVSASHSWANYHWARTTNPFTLKVGDNVDSKWDAYLTGAIADWNQSTVLDLTPVTGQSPRKQCRPTAGQIEVCNDRY